MRNSVIFLILPLIVTVFLVTGGCEKESGLPVDGDGNHYDTVVIGTQVWLKENLKTTRYNNGVKIPLVTDDDKWASMTSAAYCWYNNSPEKYKENYGALYNWYVVNSGLLCPVGWRVPTKEDWETLINYLGGPYGGSGIKLKDTEFWNCPPGYIMDCRGTNESGFSARPGGLRCLDGDFDGIGYFALFWCRPSFWDPLNPPGPSNVLIHATESSAVIRHPGSSSRNAGISVRCIKNQ